MSRPSHLARVTTGLLCSSLISFSLLGQTNHGPVEVSAAVQHDVSPPLRGLSAFSPGAEQHQERPLKPVPQNVIATNGSDPVVQQNSGPLVSAAIGMHFPGVGNGDYGFSVQYAPPDTNGAVGDTQYVQWVNVSYAVFNKTTGKLQTIGLIPGNALWKGFGGGCEINNDGDPIVQYDKSAKRWILTQFSVSTTPYLQCVAVSTTSDALGTYNRYAFSYGNTQFNDYPKLGVWSDAYYITYNIFNNGSSFAGSKLCALDRTAMLAGNAATQQCYQLSTSYGGVLPADLDGITPPPTGTPGLLMNYGANSLNLWKFSVDFANSANTKLTGPTNIPVATFTAACSGGGACIPQAGTNQKLDSLADRLMYRLAYRNRGGTESLVVNHSVSTGGTRNKQVTSVRWYELRNPSGSTMAAGTPVVYQQGTLGTSDGISRWMGSIAMDKNGNIALGYSASSPNDYPSIRYTGRALTDSLNTMQTESTIIQGSGSQLPNLSRWGDYSALTVDPVDDCTFWYTTEYLKSSGTFNWSTYIASFKMAGCQ